MIDIFHFCALHFYYITIFMHEAHLYNNADVMVIAQLWIDSTDDVELLLTFTLRCLRNFI